MAPLAQKDSIAQLLQFLKPNDLLCVMGAGDITGFVQEFVHDLSQGELAWLSRRDG